MVAPLGAAQPHGYDPGIDKLFERGWLIPSARSMAGIHNTLSRVYSSRFDEAIRDYPENARTMRNDSFLTALMLERTAPLKTHPWEVVLDEDNHPSAKTDPNALQVRSALESCVRRTRRFHEMRDYLSEYLWYGRYGSQVVYGWDNVGGYRRRVVLAHEPIDGDNILPTFDGYPAIAIHPADRKVYQDRFGDDSVSFSNNFTVLKLYRSDLRQRFIIPRHHIRAGDYFWPETAGRIGGYGIRHQVYWTWWLRQKTIESMTAFMNKVGTMGLLVFYYEENNDDSKRKAEDAAAEANERNAIIVPVPKGKDAKTGGMDLFPANTAGVQFLVDVAEKFYERHIERLIVGQAASASSEGGQLGGNSSDFQMDTKFQLIKCDATATADAFTSDLLEPMLEANFPGVPWKYKFRFVLPDPTAEKRLNAVQKAWSMGAGFGENKVIALTGVEKPDPGENILRQQQQQPPQMPPDGAAQPRGDGPPDDFGGGGGDPQPVPGMGELVTAMVTLAAEGDHHAMDMLTRLGRDPEAFQALLDGEEDGSSIEGNESSEPNSTGVQNYQWQASQTKAGTLKAIWVGDGTRKPLYAEPARRALARQGKQDSGEPLPSTPQQKAQELKRQREPGREEARQTWQKALENPASVQPEQLPELAEQLKRLTRDELRGHLRSMQQRVGGLKQSLVDRMLEHVRGQGGPAEVTPVPATSQQPAQEKTAPVVDNTAGAVKIPAQGEQVATPKQEGAKVSPVELKGSAKQIEWANKIRETMLSNPEIPDKFRSELAAGDSAAAWIDAKQTKSWVTALAYVRGPHTSDAVILPENASDNEIKAANKSADAESESALRQMLVEIGISDSDSINWALRAGKLPFQKVVVQPGDSIRNINPDKWHADVREIRTLERLAKTIDPETLAKVSSPEKRDAVMKIKLRLADLTGTRS